MDECYVIVFIDGECFIYRVSTYKQRGPRLSHNLFTETCVQTADTIAM